MENVTLKNYSILEISSKGTILAEWTRYILISFMVGIATVGIPANAFVVIILSRLREKASTETYMCALSFADLISSSLCTIGYILRYEQTTWDVLASSVFCRLHVFLLYVTSVFSTILVALIAHDRFKTTSFGNVSMTSHKHEVKIAKRKCAIVATVSILYCTSALITTTLDEDTRLCSRTQSHETIGYILDSVLVLIFLCMFGVTAFCYTRISYFLTKHNKKRNQLRQETNTKRAIRKISSLFRQPSEYMIRKKVQICVPISEGHVNTPTGTGKTAKNIRQSRCVSFNRTVMHHGIENASSSKLNTTCISIATINVPQPNFTGNDVISNEEISKVESHCDRRLKQNKTDEARDRKRKKRTTLMMFLITVIYTSTWFITWIASIVEVSMSINLPGLLLMMKKMYMINSVINPVLYVLMSSKFREHARNLFRHA
jgi:predicted nucleic acid-binding Zn ribbon protein